MGVNGSSFFRGHVPETGRGMGAKRGECHPKLSGTTTNDGNWQPTAGMGAKKRVRVRVGAGEKGCQWGEFNHGWTQMDTD